MFRGKFCRVMFWSKLLPLTKENYKLILKESKF